MGLDYTPPRFESARRKILGWEIDLYGWLSRVLFIVGLEKLSIILGNRSTRLWRFYSKGFVR